MVAPRQLSAVFLLVLALFTSLPLPTILSLLLGLLVSVLHLFALATCGGAGIQENENETSGEHFKRVREKEIYRVKRVCLYTKFTDYIESKQRNIFQKVNLFLLNFLNFQTKINFEKNFL